MRHLLLTSLLVLPLASIGAETLYIQSAKAKLLDQPSFSAKTVDELDKGEAVVVEKREERWINARHGSAIGWISSLLLSPQKPISKISILGDAGDISDNARRRASAVITAGATRGLSADDRKRIGDNEISNYAALRWVEDITLSESEIARFEAESIK